MKNLVLAMAMLVVASVSVAQNAKVTTANNYLKQGELIKAKNAIDEANKHEKTAEKPKTLAYMGKVYYAISIDTTAETAPYRKDAIFIAADAFEKVKANPDNRTDMGEVNMYLMVKIYNKMWDQGAEYYNAKEYSEASKCFFRCAQIKEKYNDLDTIAYFYAGNAAAASQEHEKAVEIFNKIKDTDYQNGVIYSRLSNEYMALGDTTQAFATIGEGRTKYPDNQDLLIKEFNMYVDMGENEKAIANIDAAILANPENAPYLFVRGKLKETTGDLAGAEADYKAAIAIDNDYLDANHELGAMYVNSSRSIVKEMNDLPLSATKKYDELKAQLDELYKKALPYLQKAYELEPSDKEVQTVLLQLYSKVGDMDNYNKLKGEIDAAK